MARWPAKLSPAVPPFASSCSVSIATASARNKKSPARARSATTVQGTPFRFCPTMIFQQRSKPSRSSTRPGASPRRSSPNLRARGFSGELIDIIAESDFTTRRWPFSAPVSGYTAIFQPCWDWAAPWCFRSDIGQGMQSLTFRAILAACHAPPCKRWLRSTFLPRGTVGDAGKRLPQAPLLVTVVGWTRRVRNAALRASSGEPNSCASSAAAVGKFARITKVCQEGLPRLPASRCDFWPGPPEIVVSKELDSRRKSEVKGRGSGTIRQRQYG